MSVQAWRGAVVVVFSTVALRRANQKIQQLEVHATTQLKIESTLISRFVRYCRPVKIISIFLSLASRADVTNAACIRGKSQNVAFLQHTITPL